jgi:hypothetical protein
MRMQSALEVLAAWLDEQPIQIHNTGQWCDWDGTIKELVGRLQNGTLFRVKRVPRTIYMLQKPNGPLVDPNFQKREWVANVQQPGETIVEFREVTE